MTETLADIEALAITCRSDEAQEYVSEALKCYGAGAYRAAIVSTWIAVVFDLIDKVRELALAEDGAAKELAAQYETYIEQIEEGNPQGIESALEFERNLLDICSDRLQFFDVQQLLDLKRLREDRHRSAHPSFQRVGVPYHPSAEQARLHLRNAIVHVLAQPPVQGKAALAELMAMVSSAYFPEDEAKALSQLQSSALANSTDALVRGFVDTMVFGYLTEASSLFAKSRVFSAINAAFEMFPAIVEERLGKQLEKVVRDAGDDLIFHAICLVLGIHRGWSVVSVAAKQKIQLFVDESPVEEFLGLLASTEPVEELSASIDARVNGLEFDDLVIAVDLLGLGQVAKTRAMEFLSEVGSWDRANSVLTKAIFPLFSDLTKADVEHIIKMPTEFGADLPGAHAYEIFIDKVRERDIIDEATLNQLLIENRASYLLPQAESDSLE